MRLTALLSLPHSTDDLDVGVISLDIADRLQDITGMAVGCVDDENVHAGPNQDLGSRLPVLSRSNGCSDRSRPKGSLQNWDISHFLDVLDGDETFQVILSIHDQQFSILFF